MIPEKKRLLQVYVADRHRKRRKVHPFKRFRAVQNFLSGKNQSECMLDGYSMSTQQMHSAFLWTARFFFTHCILFASAGAVGPGLHNIANVPILT